MKTKIRLPILCPNCGTVLMVNVARTLGQDRNCPECKVYLQLEYKKEENSDRTVFYFVSSVPSPKNN